LLFPNESDFITVLEVGAPKELPMSSGIEPKSPQKQPKQPKVIQKRGTRPGSNAGLLPTILEPSVLPTIVVKSIIPYTFCWTPSQHQKVFLSSNWSLVPLLKIIG
jgi:hypothetical protein